MSTQSPRLYKPIQAINYIFKKTSEENVDKIKALAAEKKVSISWTPKKTLQEMTKELSTKALFFVWQPLLHRLGSDSETDSPRREPTFIDSRWFDRIRTILDLSYGQPDATNVSGVIIPKHRAVGVTPVVSKLLPSGGTHSHCACDQSPVKL